MMGRWIVLRAAVAAALFSALARAQEPAAPVPPAEPVPSPLVEAATAEPPREPVLEGLVVHPGGLTADEAARRALAASSSVAGKRAEVEAANALIRQTTIQFFPQLNLRASYTRLNRVSAALGQGSSLVGAFNPGPLSTGPCPGGVGECVLDSAGVPVAATEVAIEFPQNNYSLSAQLSVPVSDYALRVANAAASASASRDAAHYALEAEKLKVQADARILYYNWLRSTLQVFNARKALERNQARLGDARAQFEVGTASKADLLRLEALVANTELSVQQTEALTALGNAQLAIIMEDDDAGVYRPGQGIGTVAEAVPPASQTKALVAEALRRRLEVKALDATQRSLRKGASASNAGILPRVDVTGDVTYANPNPRFFPPQQEWNTTWSVGIAASWNVTDAFLTSSKTDELEAKAQQVVAQRRGLVAAINQEVVAARLDLTKALAAIRTSDTALRAAEEAYRVTVDLYRAGKATTTDLIEAESDLLVAKLGETDARIDLRIAGLRLRHATGRDVALR